MKCFYHNDLDGHCAGSLVARYENNYNIEDFYEVDYNQELPINKVQDEEKVYFVDYSFTEKTVHSLVTLMSKRCEIIWIDHHESSLRLEENEKYPWLKNIKGIRNKDYCGAMLTYFYLYLEGEFNNEIIEKLTPEYIKYVDDYDCWKYNFNELTNYFKLGIETLDWSVFSDIWNTFYVQDENAKTDLIREVIQTGKIIKTYIDNDNERYRNQYMYESSIGGYKCAVINRKTNSWIFGEKYKEYPLVMVWAFNGEKYSFSIFSSNPKVNCAAIAESYGGGGHVGAAGFTLDNMPFIKI